MSSSLSVTGVRGMSTKPIYPTSSSTMSNLTVIPRMTKIPQYEAKSLVHAMHVLVTFMYLWGHIQISYLPQRNRHKLTKWQLNQMCKASIPKKPIFSELPQHFSNAMNFLFVGFTICICCLSTQKSNEDQMEANYVICNHFM